MSKKTDPESLLYPKGQKNNYPRVEAPAREASQVKVTLDEKPLRNYYPFCAKCQCHYHPPFSLSLKSQQLLYKRKKGNQIKIICTSSLLFFCKFSFLNFHFSSLIKTLVSLSSFLYSLSHIHLHIFQTTFQGNFLSILVFLSSLIPLCVYTCFDCT